jgi:hypothetical protein
MISGWVNSALGCGNTESNPKADEPAENVPVGSQCQRYPLSDYCATRTCPVNQTEAEAAARNLCASSAVGAHRYRKRQSPIEACLKMAT